MKTKVLLVEDEKDFAETSANRIEARNLTATNASNGDEAISILKEKDRANHSDPHRHLLKGANQ